MQKLLTVGLLTAAVALAQRPVPLPAFDDETGFVSIFDGKTLEGWDGNPVYWKVENGAIVGTITPETVIKRNTFLIWRGGEPKRPRTAWRSPTSFRARAP